MIAGARYVHTNLVARDWRRLAVNRPGFSHIAFAVDSVEDARAECLAAGGTPVGQTVTLTTPAGSKVTWCYLADPEGNIVELQHWQNV